MSKGGSGTAGVGEPHKREMDGEGANGCFARKGDGGRWIKGCRYDEDFSRDLNRIEYMKKKKDADGLIDKPYS